MRRFPEAGVITLGVCLGHQSMAQAFGGRVIRHEPVHGKTGLIEHDGRTACSAGLPRTRLPSGATTRWSWIADLPDEPRGDRATADGVVMAILATASCPREGVQFHPESVLTPRTGRAAARVTSFA